MEMHGVYGVVPTAFHDDGSLDTDGTAALVAAYGDAGVSGVVVLGVMGEGHLLDPQERASVVRTALRVTGGLPVLVGLGSPDDGCLERARAAADLGAAGVLAALGPVEVREELLVRLCEGGLPVVAQDHPGATGTWVTRDEVVSLLASSGAAALKAEAPPTPDLIAAVRAADGPPAFGGLSARWLIEELEAGAVGTMTGVAIPDALVEVVARFRGGDRSGAMDRYLTATPYLRLESMPGTVGLTVRKEAWRQRGVIASSRVRRGEPLGRETKRAITRRLRDAGLEVSAPMPDVA